MILIGHKPQLAQLHRAASAGQLANAYLLSGPDGIGKKMAALQFIKELFCTNNHKSSTINCSCLSCQKVDHLTHPDLITIAVEEDKKDISIDQLRDMQSSIQMSPIEGRYRFVIIDDAERMNDNTSNSALKSLEEPPKDTHFFIITSRPHKLLATILSRCQKLQFSPPSEDEAVPFIQERKNVNAETARLLSLITCGSLGQAITFPDDAISDASDVLRKVWNRMPPSELIAISERWGKADNRPDAILNVLTAIYHDIAVHQATGKPMNFNSLEKEMISVSSRTTLGSTQDKISNLLSAQNDLETTANKQLLFEQLLFSLGN